MLSPPRYTFQWGPWDGVSGVLPLCSLDLGIGLLTTGEAGCSCKMTAEACWNLR